MFSHVAGLMALRSVVSMLVCARVEMSTNISSDPKLLTAHVSLPGAGWEVPPTGTRMSAELFVLRMCPRAISEQTPGWEICPGVSVTWAC